MEKFFNHDAAYEKWDRKNKNKGRGNYFEEEENKSYLKGLKGRVQNNLSGFLRIVLTALMVLIQCLFIVFLPFVLQSVTVYFYFIWEITSVIVIVALVNRNQSPSYRLAWISIVMLLPLSGFIMFYLWGRDRSGKRRLDQYILRQISYGNQFLIQDEDVYLDFISENPVPGRMVKYMENEGFPLTSGNAVDFYPMGEDVFEEIFRDLEKAEKFILIDFFIVAEGGIWDKMHEILKRKVEQGVEVKFLYDDFGAAIRTRKYFKQILEHEGFEMRVFNPIHKYTGELYMNYRSHQKILVIDGEVGYTGGFNLADEYANLIERFGVWKDTGIRIRGDAVWGLTVVFLQMWEASENTGGHVDYLDYKVTFPRKCGNVFCQVISDGPANNPDNPIESIYNQMIVYADQYLYITTPYLIIEDYMKNSLIEAVKRGVDVRIITPGIPDKKNVKLLTNYNYGLLLREGVKIYEYTPGFIHAKQILTENSVIIGTINMDYRSFYLHYENGVWMSGKEIQEAVRTDFFKTFKESKEITYEEWLGRPLWWKLVQPLLNLFSTLF
ncbi:MAG: cardiolipin synthase [Lachnospiraceae bacterium]